MSELKRTLREFEQDIESGVRTKVQLGNFYSAVNLHAESELKKFPIKMTNGRKTIKMISDTVDLMQAYYDLPLKSIQKFTRLMYKRGWCLPVIALDLFSLPVYKRIFVVRFLADFYIGRPEHDLALHFMLYESYPDLTPENVINYALPDQQPRLQKIMTMDLIPLCVTDAILAGISQRRPKEFKL